MAKNDQLLLDGVIDDRIAVRLPSHKRDEAFEYLAFEQILKDFDFSSEEIKSGSVDGGQDGGLDGFYIIVNGHLLQDVESFAWPKTGSELHVVLITCKHHDTFKQAALDAMVATLTELFDFAIEDGHLAGAYSDTVLSMRNNLKYACRKLAPRLSKFKINVCYASRGDTSMLGHEVVSRGNQIVSVLKECFGSCDVDFGFVGASELISLYRKLPNYTMEIPFLDSLSKGEQYVILVRLSDYYDFVSNGGSLRRYLFESNVRDFMGMNRVNEDIKSTLQNPTSSDFWWLNNGVTILASSAVITGKSIQANDIQIVNGLQTTESIFRHFNNAPQDQDDRCVLIKVIVSNDDAVRDAIIRATNNQTDVELASLHATDKIQRDIEEILLREGLFYERRKNHYVNQGHLPAELVTPLYVASGYVALILKCPHRAATLRSKFMRSVESYELVFSKSAPLGVWAKIARILKRVDFELEALRPTDKATDRFLKGWRYIVAFLLVSDSFKRFSFSAVDLLNYDDAKIDSHSVVEIWTLLNEQVQYHPKMKGWSSKSQVLSACSAIAESRGINHVSVLGRIGYSLVKDLESTTARGTKRSIRKPITDEFVQKVRAILPAQPWKPGVHRVVCSQLQCTYFEYSEAVNRLIDEGVFYRQRNGVLYDHDGHVVAFDLDRVNPETLELID